MIGVVGRTWGPWTSIGETGLLVRERPRTAALRIYVDTSVIGGCCDDPFREASLALIERARRGEVTLVVSEVTADELEQAPAAVGTILD